MANFIKGAIKHPGALTASAKRAGMSPMAFAAQHKHDSGVTGRRARLALTLRKLAKHRGKHIADTLSASRKQS